MPSRGIQRILLRGGCCALAAGLALGLGVSAPAAHAQDAPQAEASSDARVELDLNALLTEARVTEGRIEDPVWQLAPAPGRVFVLLPLRITPPSRGEVQLSRPGVELAGARFLAWWIPPAAGAGGGATQRFVTTTVVTPGEAPETAERFETGDSRWSRFLGESQDIPLDPNDDAQRQTVREVVTVVDDAVSAAPENQDAPRLVRTLSVNRRGTVAWTLDRIPGASVAGSGENPYLYKLDPARMRDAAPPRPDRPQRNAGEDARAFNDRRREADAAYRVATERHRALQQQVRSLPESFSEPLPPTVWAVFERPEGRNSFEFTGPAPLPWSIPAEGFEQMRQYAGPTGRGGGQGDLTADELAAIASFSAALRTGHPLTARTVASVLSHSGLLGRSQVDDPVSRLAEQVIDAGDGDATRTLSLGLASVVPPTRGTTTLLAKAARTGNPFARLAALRATLLTEAGKPGGVARVVQQADAILSDPQGPDPGLVLASLIETAGEQPDARQALLAGVRFEGLPPERFDRAAAYVIRNAAEPDGLPAAWLDLRLLGSPDPTTARRTLELLARSGAGSRVVAPLVAALREKVFTPGVTPADASTGAGTPLDLTVTEGIALTSTSHGLFKALQSGDADTRRLGWDAVRLFVIPANAGRSPTGDSAAADDDPLDAILRAATSQTTTPASLVDFLARQEDQERTTAALVKLAAQGDPRLADRAVTRLRGSGRPLDRALAAADPVARVGFAEALFRATRGDIPPVAKLARDERVAQWLGTHVAQQGVVPEPAAWLEGAGGETAVMTLASDTDDDLAHGALAALAAAAGGDTLDQFAVIDALGGSPRNADTLREKWPQEKLAIQVGKLAAMAGDYRLILEVRGHTPEDDARPDGSAFGDPGVFGGPGGAGLPGVTVAEPPVAITPTRLVLGIVQLGVEGSTIKLAGDPVTLTVPQDALALRIADPLQLKNFPNDELQEIPLDRAAAPLDLYPGPTGTWRGKSPLGETHMLVVTMEPTR